MPVLIPLAASAAAWFGAGAVVTAGWAAGAVSTLGATLVGAISGAVIGAAVGALGAALTGGDIGQSALFGALGGAVAGGFAGFSAGAAAEGPASSNMINAKYANDSTLLANAESGLTGAEVAKDGGGLFGSMGEGKAMLIGSGIETLGTGVAGWAQGEAQKEISEDSIAAGDKARQEEFEQRLQEIREQHEARLGEIGEQNAGALALADKNNASAMEQLQTRIQHEKDTVSTANKREDDKIAGFNDSIRGTDANLFNRPTFQFEATPQEDAFDSGFNEAVAANGGQTSSPLTPEQIAEIERQKQAVA